MVRTKHKAMLISWVLLISAFAFIAGNSVLRSAGSIEDPATWGGKYTSQYASYLLNYRQIAQRFGGSDDRSRLMEHPFSKDFYKGLSFSIEFNASRGHVYALEDVKNVARPKAAAICLTCKTSALPRLVDEMGEEEFYKADFAKTAEEALFPVSCANCHDPADMSRRITNPALKTALEASGADVEALDQSQMRMLSCAQCHVEYYFTYKDLKLILPWSIGLDPASVEAYYDGIGFSDWIHPDSGVGLLKVQHPEYETYRDSIHDMMGLTCADCHMPQVGEEGAEHTSHWWTSPLNHLEESPCLMCHDETVKELKERVLALQEATSDRFDSLGVEIVRLHKRLGEIKAALDSGKYAEISELIRSAQFRVDWVFSENSTGFHNNAMLMGLLDEAEGQIAEASEALK